MREGQLENGNTLLTVLNDNLLSWAKKPSHPWIGIIRFGYDGSENNGMPVQQDYEMLSDIEDEILEELKVKDGYLNIGRQTGENLKEVFFAFIDYRKPSMIFAQVQDKYGTQFAVEFDIYKDKYWQSFASIQ